MEPSRPALWTAAGAALRGLQNGVRWKAGRDVQHLAKRKALGHLSATDSVGSYNALILRLVHSAATVYKYDFRGTDYFAIRGIAFDLEWLVIFDQWGIGNGISAG